MRLASPSMLRAAVLSLAIAMGTGCTTPKADDSSQSVTARARLPVGTTHYFPARGYKLDKAPTANQNAVFDDEATGRSAFVAHLEGEYHFSGPRQVTLQAVAARTLSFHNHNYYPTRAIASVGDALWVAAVYAPELIEVGRTDLTARGAIAVGSWPVAVASDAKHGRLLVASRGEDALTLVDLATRRAVRSVWIGDEVSNVVVTNDGDTAVALAPVDAEVVLLDLASLRVRARIRVGGDPSHLALSADGKRAYVAGRRTGKQETCASCGADLSEIDLTTGRVTRSVTEVGTTIGGLGLTADGKQLIVATTRSNNGERPEDGMSNPKAGNFRHTLVVYDLTGAEIVEGVSREVTLATAGAAALVSLYAPVVVGNSVWVVAEASDAVVRFDLATLIELERQPAGGRPRSLVVSDDGTLYAYGHQQQKITELKSSGVRESAPILVDPRPPAEVAGERFFTGPGVSAPIGPPQSGLLIAGNTWSCSSCHADGLTDKLVWQAGPLRTHRYVSRPFAMLEGTWPLGWQGYLSSVRNYSYTVTGNIGIFQPTNAQTDSLYAYLASLMPPPPANSKTERDGAMTAQALRGQTVFARDCSSCHAGALTTSRGRTEVSIGDGKRADIPALIGVYRDGAFFRKGTATTLREAVDQMVIFVRSKATPTEIDDLTRYLEELTARELFLLTELPSNTRLLAADAQPELIFSQPIWKDERNLARIQLENAAGVKVATRKVVEGRHVRLEPEAPLTAGEEYLVKVEAGLISEWESTSSAPSETRWKIAQAAQLKLEGTYRLTVGVPSFGPPMMPPGPPPTSEVFIDASWRKEGGANLVVRYPRGKFTWSGTATVSGNTLQLPPIPIPVSNGYADSSSGFEATLVDETNDGIADRVVVPAMGLPRRYTLSGPGFEYSELTWDLVRTVTQ